MFPSFGNAIQNVQTMPANICNATLNVFTMPANIYNAIQNVFTMPANIYHAIQNVFTIISISAYQQISISANQHICNHFHILHHLKKTNMKKLYILSALLFVAVTSHAQVFWTEDFNNGCTANCAGVGYTGLNGAWTQTITGAEEADPNIWYVSCAENGHTPGICGTGCASASATATLATLHVGASQVLIGDMGASYDAGGFCPSLTCPETDRRIESPTINCTGQSSITLGFNYITAGSPPNDQCTLWYFDGTTWNLLPTLTATPTGCSGGQGQWTAFSTTLPASANNNANVKIGFRWVNNDDGVGTDPSFAVDNITLASNPTGIASYSTSNVSVLSKGNGMIQVNANGIDYKVLGVYNMLGQESKFTQADNQLQLGEETSGIYIVALEINGVRVVRKVMVN